MNEVSCKVFDVFWAALAAKNVPIDQAVAGTDIPFEKLRSRKERIDWAEFAAVMRNIRPHFTDDEYRELGRQYLRAPGLRFAFVIARLALSPMDFYRWFSKPREGVGNQMFNCVIPIHRELGPNEIELDLTLPEGFEVCWDFFVISAGNVEEMPRLLGHPRAKVTLTRLPNGGRYHIFVPPGVALLPRIWRFVTRPFTARAAAKELREAHETLIDRFEQLEAARQVLDRQAARLKTAHTLNTLVQRDADLDSTLATIAKVLVDDAGFAHAELHVFDGDRRVAHGSEGGREPLVRTLDTRGGQQLGKVTVTPTPGDDREEREQLLEFIAPTIALSLENAVYRSGLERLVEVRTAELQNARDDLAGTVVQLREAQGARERFFGNISHEIRTPLSIIMLAAADVAHRAGTLLDERARQSLGAVTDAARKLVRLVDELLLLAAGHENKLVTRPEPTDLAAMVRAVEASWRPAAEAAGLQLAVTSPSSLVASIDPVALERILSNLISNAVKYTPRGGEVGLELAADAHGIRISVLDTGPGIAAELAPRLFGRFERATSADRVVSGTGLGLALAKQLVEAHGGTLAYHPRATGGTEMRVELPAALVRTDTRPAPVQLRLVDAASPAPTAPASSLTPAGIARGTIVVAEDDAVLAEQVARVLGEDYTVHVAHDGHAALVLVEKHRPQLLITDVDMPGMDGVELSRRFRELTQDRLAPIVILSAMLDIKTRIAGLEAGAVDYVTKPFDPRELRARVGAQFRMRELAVRLHRAEQFQSLGVLTSGLAHELRNPANAIVNAVPPLLALLPTELKDPDHPVATLLDVIGTCAQQLGVLARQLLGLHNADSELELRPARLLQLVERATALCKPTLDGVDVKTELPAELTVTCAPPLLTQVLTNLLENAAHAAGRGGWVKVTGGVADGRTWLEVTDSGPGVPVELRDKIFEPFFTTKPQGVGTGLGLPLSRDIMQRHGGTLAIRDRGGRHAFVLELPRTSGVDAAATAV